MGRKIKFLVLGLLAFPSLSWGAFRTDFLTATSSSTLANVVVIPSSTSASSIFFLNSPLPINGGAGPQLSYPVLFGKGNFSSLPAAFRIIGSTFPYFKNSTRDEDAEIWVQGGGSPQIQLLAGNGNNVSLDNTSGLVVNAAATFTSSMTLSGSRLVQNKSPTDGQVLTWNAANNNWTPAAASSGGGWLAVGTGTASNFTTSITSPTYSISFLGSQFVPTTSGTTDFLNLNQASVTVQGVITAGSNISVTPTASVLTISLNTPSVYAATSTAILPLGFKTSTGVFTSLSPGVMHIVAGSSNVVTNLVSLSSETTGTLSVINSTLPVNSIVFSDGAKLTVDTANLYFSTNNKTMGLGTNSIDAGSVFVIQQSTIQLPVTAATVNRNAGAGASNYNAGDTLAYRFYAYRKINGTLTAAATYYQSISTTVANTGDTLSLTWSAVTGASGYLIVRNLNGIGFADYYVDMGNILGATDDNGFDLLSWTSGTPPITVTNFRALYNYVSGAYGYSVFGGAGYFYGSLGVGTAPNQSYGTDLYNTAISTTPLRVNRGSTSYPAFVVSGTEHSSALPSALSIVDSTNVENVGLTSWNGGGGTGGYGTVVVSGNGGAGIRLGEIGGKNQQNGFRLGDFIFQTGSAADNGEIVVLLGSGGGAFIYAQYIGQNGTNFGGSAAPGARVQIAGGTSSVPPLRFASSALTTSNRTAGDFQFLTNKWYGTSTTGPYTREFTMNDNTLTSTRMVFVSTNGFLTDNAQITYSTITATLSVASFSASGLISGTTAQFNSSMTVTGAMKVGGLVNFSSSVVIVGGIVAATSTINGKLTVTGSIDPTNISFSTNTQYPTAPLYIESFDGINAGTAPVNAGRIRYNNTTKTFQISVSSGLYQNISTDTIAGAGTGTQYSIPRWATTTTLGDSLLTTDSANKTMTFTPAASSGSGNIVVFRITAPAHTGTNTGTLIDFDMINAGDIDVVAGSNIPAAYGSRFTPRSFSASGSGTTVSTAATVIITGGPTSSTGGTLSVLNSYALYVQSGAALFDSTLAANAAATFNGATGFNAAATSNISMKQKAGTGTLYGNVGGTLFAYYVSSGNAALTDTDLYRSSVTANTLTNAGDSLYVIAGGTFATSVSTDKRVKLKFNATTVFDSGALSITTASTWNLTCSLVRVAATTQRTTCNFETSSTSFPGTASHTESSENLAIGNVLRITGGGTNANDTTGATHRVNMEPAP